MKEFDTDRIAIVGMAIKAPCAESLDQFWINLSKGRDCFTRPNRDQLEKLGIRPGKLKDPSCVAAKPLLDRIEYFDSDFFGIPDPQAELMDPCHRLFLEVVWEALENAAELPNTESRITGLFGGVDTSEISYLSQNLGPSLGNVNLEFNKRLGTSPDYFSLRAANALDLTGPVLTTMATCSTSLLAVHLAAQNLRQGKCYLAIAGGARIELPSIPFYKSAISGMHSLSGHVRPFDAGADGTVFGNGTAAVVLKRLGDAIRDGNHIHGVILGTGFCNDGNPPDKLSFTAPAPSGQTRAIEEAIGEAGIHPRRIGYVECHGTGTLLGDPTEVKSLTDVFRGHTSDTGYCAIGSVKANIGHLGSAAGVTSLIKTCLALQNGVIPGNAKFTAPNPEIEFEQTPFFVNRDPISWHTNGAPRLAGVSAFGFGGANAHVIVEQYVEPASSPRVDDPEEHLLVVSARTPDALTRRLSDLATHLEKHPRLDLADVANTLKHGRKVMPVRVHTVVRSSDKASLPRVLRGLRPQLAGAAANRPVVFLFPGQGSQELDMGKGLYDSEPGFRETVDYCAAALEPELGFDLRTKIYGERESRAAAEAELTQTGVAQPALFVVEYALARLFQQWGVKPIGMLGHSLGELVAACLAGVFSLDDGLRMVAIRSQLMQKCRPGSMLAVVLPLSELLELMPDSLDLAGINSPNGNVVAGPIDDILQFAAEMDERGTRNRILNTSHAFHSRMLDTTLEEFGSKLAQFEYHPPKTTVMSNVTGTPMTESQALNPEYWVEQRRRPVRFSDGLSWFLTDENPIFVEVGPGKALSGLVHQHDPARDTVTALFHTGGEKHPGNGRGRALDALGRVWSLGGSIDWPPPATGERRVTLPTYPFQGRYLWKEDGEPSRALPLYLYEPSWFERPLPASGGVVSSDTQWLIFADDLGVADGLTVKLTESGHNVTVVESGDQLLEVSNGRYEIVPGDQEHLDHVTARIELSKDSRLRVLHFWSLTGDEPPETDMEALDASMDTGFHTLVGFLQAAHGCGFASRVDMQIYADGLSQLQQESETILPHKGVLLGPVLTGPREIPGLTMRCIDIPRPDRDPDSLSGEIFKECQINSEDNIVVLRDHGRYAEKLSECPPLSQSRGRLRDNAAVLVTGGMGGLGLEIAGLLHDTFNARLVLTSRWELPPPGDRRHFAAENSKIDRALKTIASLEDRGAEILVVKADVCDIDDMRSALQQAREAFGPIHGVIHAAGVLDDGPLLQKTPERAEKVIATKVKSALILEELFEDEPLDVFIHFSSKASTQPAPGQVDYSSANAVLDRLARRGQRRNPGLCCAIGWGAWRDAGMAWDLGERKRTDRSIFPEREQRTFDTPLTLGHPLIRSCRTRENGDVLLTGLLIGGDHWVTTEHCIRGRPVVSGTTILEMFRAGFSAVQPSAAAVEMSKILFYQPFLVYEATDFEIFGRHEEGRYRFELRSREKNSGDTWTTNASLVASVLEGGPVSDSDTIENLKPFGDRAVEPVERTGFGPRWECGWTGERIGDDAYIHAALKPEFTEEVTEYRLHPALFDRAIHLIIEQLSGMLLPYAVESMRIYGDLPAEVLAWGRRISADEDIHDIVIADLEGRVLVEIDNYLLRPFTPWQSGHWGGFIKDGASREVSTMALGKRGHLDSFKGTTAVMPEPGPDEISIQVKAAGLNFRDVLSALGQMPDNDPSAHLLGTECSGVVMEVGRNIRHVEPGDRVVALSDGCFATAAIAKGHLVTYLPASLSFTEGASIPITFLTVDYALNRLANLRRGESILIHSAAGGIGLAAVQIAKRAGAKIFATAGHETKREFLHGLGIEHVMNSRNLDFAEEIKTLTEGEGVDVVLNSLAGEYIAASMDVLKPFGRFLEIGKKDIYEGSPLNLYPFRNNLSYYGVDLGQFRFARQAEFLEMFEDLMREFAMGRLSPIPIRSFPLNQISRGFQHMALGRHIGKVVFTVDENMTPADRNRESFRTRFGRGIAVDDGLDVFRHLVCSDQAPASVVVTPDPSASSDNTGARYRVATGPGPRKSEDFVEPRNRNEEILKGIWEKILGVSPISMNDEFSELGGDSINAIMIQAAVQEAFEVDLSLAVLLRSSIGRLSLSIGGNAESTGQAVHSG